MNASEISEFLGACFEARRIVDLMPKLPKQMKPSHIHVIDIICQLQRENGTVRISDIGSRLHITNPSITRIVSELVDMKAVKKVQSREDRRVFTVSLTAQGMKYYRKYIEEYHDAVAEKLAGIDSTDMNTAIRVVREAYRIMSNGKTTIG
jgi:DNA-binding MarR family transcriptional regulator